MLIVANWSVTQVMVVNLELFLYICIILKFGSDLLSCCDANLQTLLAEMKKNGKLGSQIGAADNFD